MKTLIIVAHPDLQSSRVNRAWTETMRQQPEATVHVLYEAYPDHQINITHEQALLDSHDRIIFQYPLYWYSTPPFAIHNANHVTDEQITASQAAYVQHLATVRHVQTSDLITINK